jgi:hypothetical protein
MGGSSMSYRTEHCVIEVVLWPVQLEVFLDERGAISNQLHSRDNNGRWYRRYFSSSQKDELRSHSARTIKSQGANRPSR